MLKIYLEKFGIVQVTDGISSLSCERDEGNDSGGSMF